MLVGTLVKEAAKILGIFDEVVKDGNIVSSKESIDLLMAVNLTNNNIAANYIELVNTNEVSTKNGVIKFEDICKFGILEIKSIKKIDNVTEVQYSIKSDGVHVDDGNYIVEYSYFPNELILAGNIDYYTKINWCIFVQGVVAEYLFLKGDIENAHLWDKKFKFSLRGALRHRKGVFLPKRRWE